MVTMNMTIERGKKMELYNFEEANAIMDKVGLARHYRSDEDSFRQFCLGGSSLHVKTKRKKQFILYSTVTDYSNIKNALLKNNRNYIELNDIENKEQFNEVIKSLQNLGLKLIVLVKNGNKKFHPSSAENYLPHEIVFYDNDSFDFVVDILSTNSKNKV